MIEAVSMAQEKKNQPLNLIQGDTLFFKFYRKKNLKDKYSDFMFLIDNFYQNNMSFPQYFRRDYKLFIKKISFDQEITLISLAGSAADEFSVTAESQCVLNEDFQFTMVERGDQPSQILTVHLFQQLKAQQIPFGVIKFNLQSEKIHHRFSKQFSIKSFSEAAGKIEYQIIASQESEIDAETVKEFESYQNQINIHIKETNEMKDPRELERVIQIKDELILQLEEQINKLIEENQKIKRKQSLHKSKERDNSKERGDRMIQLNVKVDPNTRSSKYAHNFERERAALKEQIQSLQFKNHELQIKLARLQKENFKLRNILEPSKEQLEKKQKQMRKKLQSEYDMKSSMNQMVFDKKRSLEDQRNRQNFIEKKLASQMEAYKREQSKLKDEQFRKFEQQKEEQMQSMKKSWEIQVRRQSHVLNSRIFELEKQKKERQQKQKKQRDEKMALFRIGGPVETTIIVEQLKSEKMRLQEDLLLKNEEIEGLYKKIKNLREDLEKSENQNILLRKKKTSQAQIHLPSQGQSKYKGQMDEYQELVFHQKKQIDEEKLKTQIQQLERKLDRNTKQFREKIEQKELQMKRLELNEKDAFRQKQIFADKMHDLMRTIENDRKNYLQALQNSHKYETQLKRSVDLQTQKSELQNINYRMNKEKQDHQALIKRLKSKLEERESQWTNLKAIQSQFQYIKQQCERLERSNKKFQRQYKILHERSEELEQVAQRKPKKTQNDKLNLERQNKYKQEVRRRLDILENEMSETENKFYLQQIELLLNERTNIIQHYTRRAQQQKQRIFEMEDMTKQNKQKIIEEKQREINQIKSNEVDEIDRKIQRFKNLVSGQNQVEVIQKEVDLQKRLKNIVQKFQRMKSEEQIKNRQISHLKERNKLLEENLNKKMIASQNRHKRQHAFLGFSEISEEMQRREETKKSVFEDFKKSRQFVLSKPFEELKKMNSELMREKSKLQIQNRNLKFQAQKQRLKTQDKQRQLEKMIKRLEVQLEKSKKSYDELRSNATTELTERKKQIQELQLGLKQTIQEVKTVARERDRKTKQCQQLTTELNRVGSQLTRYEDAEKLLLDKMNRQAQQFTQKQKQMKYHLEDKANSFLKIERVKDAENDKLKLKIVELQKKIQDELYESMKVKEQNENYNIKLDEYDKKLRQKSEQNNLLEETYHKYVEEASEKIRQYESQIQVLQTHFLEGAEVVKNKEIQAAELQIRLDSNEKKSSIIEKMNSQLLQIKEKLEHQNKSLNELVEDQRQEINKLRNNYSKLEEKLKIHSSEYQNAQKRNFSLEEDLFELKQLFQRKQIETLQIINQKNLIQKQCEHLREKYEKSQRDLQKLTEEKERALKLEPPSPVRSDSKKSFQVGKSMSNLSNLVVPRDAHKRQASVHLSSNVSSRRGSSERQREDIMKKKTIQKSEPEIRKQDVLRNVKRLQSINFQQKKEQKSEQDQFANQEVLKYSKDGIFKATIKEQEDEMKGTVLFQKKGEASHDVDLNQSSKINVEIASQSKKYRSDRVPPNFERSQLQNELKQQQYQIIQDNRLLNKEEQLYDSQQLENLRGQQELEILQKLKEENDFLKQQVEKLQYDKQNLQQEIISLREEGKMWKAMSENSQNPALSFPGVKINVSNEGIETNLLGLPKSGSNSHRQISFEDPSQKEKSQNQNLELTKHYEQEIKKLQNHINQIQVDLADHERAIQFQKKEKEQLQQAQQKVQKQFEEVCQQLEEQQQKNEIYNTKILELDSQNNEIKKKIEQITEQGLKKDNYTYQKIEDLYNEDKRKEQTIKQLQQYTSKARADLLKYKALVTSQKSNFRKYQQQTELQLLKTRQSQELMEEQLLEKKQEVRILAEQIIDMEALHEQAKSQLVARDELILNEKAKYKELHIKWTEVNQQVNKRDHKKSSFIEKVGQLQLQLRDRDEQLKNHLKDSAISIKKCEIRIQTQKEEHKMTRKKLQERQSHISNLKLEMARYNQLCHELEKDKASLQNEILKIEKELKQIMLTYNNQMDQLQKDKNALKRQLDKTSEMMKDKDHQLGFLNKQIIKKEKEIKELTYKLENREEQVRRQNQKNRRQIGEIYAELQMKNDNYEKIKVQLQRQSEQYFTKEYEFNIEKEKYESTIKQYKEKLNKFEQGFTEIQGEVEKYAQRPTQQEFQELIFENDLYKNRNQQLEEAIQQSNQEQQEKIYLQFRKYKMSKQREIQDLQAQMENYSAKNEDLEEVNYMLKRENEGLRDQTRMFMNEKSRYERQSRQYQEDLRELKEQLNFYKARRTEDLNKLLNSTYD